jgi:hypothetical protein
MESLVLDIGLTPEFAEKVGYRVSGVPRAGKAHGPRAAGAIKMAGNHSDIRSSNQIQSKSIPRAKISNHPSLS